MVSTFETVISYLESSFDEMISPRVSLIISSFKLGQICIFTRYRHTWVNQMAEKNPVSPVPFQGPMPFRMTHGFPMFLFHGGNKWRKFREIYTVYAYSHFETIMAFVNPLSSTTVLPAFSIHSPNGSKIRKNTLIFPFSKFNLSINGKKTFECVCISYILISFDSTSHTMRILSMSEEEKALRSAMGKSIPPIVRWCEDTKITFEPNTSKDEGTSPFGNGIVSSLP